MGLALTDACFETSNGGFHIHFENNWIISVQIGCGTYSDNQNKTNTVDKETGETRFSLESAVAEVAIISPRGNYVIGDERGGVHGWTKPQLAARLIQFTADISPGARDAEVTVNLNALLYENE